MGTKTLLAKIAGLRSFTLIELLVVISIIALLMSVLMPALGIVRRKSQEILCLSNMRQIGIAAMLYAECYKGLIPRGAGSSGVYWFQAFLPFLHERDTVDYREVKIYRCKSFPKSGTGFYGNPNSHQTVCYVVNAWERRNADYQYQTKLINIRRPASKIYMAENEAGWWRPVIKDLKSEGIARNDIWTHGHLPSSNELDLRDGRRIARSRHRDGCNSLYFDGHCEWIYYDDMTESMWKIWLR